MKNHEHIEEQIRELDPKRPNKKFKSKEAKELHKLRTKLTRNYKLLEKHKDSPIGIVRRIRDIIQSENKKIEKKIDDILLKYYEKAQDKIESLWSEYISELECGSGEDKIDLINNEKYFWEFVEQRIK